MKFLLLASAVLAAASASAIPSVSNEDLTVFDYHRRVGVPTAELIRKTEESIANDGSRIIGGSESALGQFPYQAGLVITLTNGWTSVCGSSLLTNTRLVTAAHCWWDGQFQALMFTIVLGSTTLFSGGTRIGSSTVQTHEGWNPTNSENQYNYDVAMIGIPFVTYTNNIQPIALPSGNELSNNFAGVTGTSSGYGVNNDAMNGVPQGQVLWHVNLTVITNALCQMSYGNHIVSSTLCTSGTGRVGTCGGDSGGPLAVRSNNRNVLVGIVSFGSIYCEAGLPSAYARVTSFFNWINARL